MSLPEYLLLGLLFVGLLLNARDHGKPKTGYDNFWNAAIGVALQFGLMYWAGLFH